MTRFGVVPHNRDMPGTAFKAEFPGTELVSIHFNQDSPSDLYRSIDYHCDLGRGVVAAGGTPCWSIPLPGPAQVEAVNRGDFDVTYNLLAEKVAAVDTRPGARILGRLPWEAGWRWQSNAALDMNANPNGTLHASACRRMSAIMRAVWKGKGDMVWCPEIGTPDQRIVQPEQWWPGTHHVDVIAFDFYLSKAKGHKPGDYTSGWFRNVVLELLDYAAKRGKPVGVWEFGADDDAFAADVRAFLADVKALGVRLAFFMYWNNPDDIQSQITGGQRPAIKAEVQRAFPTW